MLTIKITNSNHTLNHIFIPILLPINQNTNLNSTILERIKNYNQTNDFINNLIYLTIPKQSDHQTKLKYNSLKIKIHIPIPHKNIVPSKP